ncbi:MAG TPA: SDR family oxidoreductase [Candidatus Dormibacteraeota bacterium]|nr:SDR family oxidoreductase [Candidatus Dormibacteraeota bacterium]
MRLEGKVALITGAAGGMGRVAAGLFAAEGAAVMISDVSEEQGHKAVAEIKEAGGRAGFVRADVSKSQDVQAMVAQTVSTFGGLHVLYNNAGIMPANDGGTLETSDETWDLVMGINLRGVWLCCKYGIPAMLESGGGSIINVASFVAIVGAATPQIAYTASKGGVLSMTREIAVEWARQGIRVNAICPGPIETPMMAELLADPARRQRRMVHIPMGRFGKAEEVARAALFLASDDSSLMTGASLVVDAGITAAYVTPE